MSEIKNEALEKATQEYVQAAYYCSREETFRAGAEWQKEQDKAIIERLKNALKTISLSDQETYQRIAKEYLKEFSLNR